MSSQSLSQRQTQTLRLSPQQILYTKLLQLPVLQLEQRIKQELEENPLLEESSEMDAAIETDDDVALLSTPEPNSIADAAAQPVGSEPTTTETLPTEKPADAPPEKNDEHDFESEISEYLHDDDEGYKTENFNVPTDDERDYLQPVYEESLTENLLNQLRLIGVSDKEFAIAEELLGNLDSDGYLRCPLDIIQDGLLTLGISATEHEIEETLAKIWRLQPAGVGARNLQECLLIQLEALAGELDDEREDDRLLAHRLLSRHYNEFTMMHYQKLAQQLGVTMEQLKRAVAMIQRLNPKPAGSANGSAGNYVIPDFTVTFNGEELILTANERATPQVKISKRYKTLLGDKTQPREAREFVKQKLDSAKSFLGAIEMRRHTMHKIVSAIVQRQHEFFIEGASKLKPMILKDIAEDTGMDISTVSRVVNGKYVQGDKGIWELKYFFSTAVETESGDEISNRIIKQQIKEFVEKEEHGKPLSDDKLAELLSDRGFKVARRTVTKYREQLNIPVARLRKKIDTLT
ncbi:MAG: hypothetical protein HY22_05150 [[Candidatus Thermochlorobacteriaceae] bacterium GBChlB]|nr:MAG: hypothetical protein HY22_05150 [[Candidatus Thermochlorobacteriaceae] bacterium GBChlB]